MNDLLVQIGNNTFRLHKRENGTYVSTPVSAATETVDDGIPLHDESKLLAEYPSKSNPGETHKVWYSKQSGIYCTCIGFGVHKYCWHVVDVLKKMCKET